MNSNLSSVPPPSISISLKRSMRASSECTPISRSRIILENSRKSSCLSRFESSESNSMTAWRIARANSLVAALRAAMASGDMSRLFFGGGIRTLNCYSSGERFFPVLQLVPIKRHLGSRYRYCTGTDRLSSFPRTGTVTVTLAVRGCALAPRVQYAVPYRSNFFTRRGGMRRCGGGGGLAAPDVRFSYGAPRPPGVRFSYRAPRAPTAPLCRLTQDTIHFSHTLCRPMGGSNCALSQARDCFRT